MCGEGYVVGASRGADIVGFASIAVANASESTNLRAKLSGSYFGQTASVDIGQYLDTVSKSSNIILTFRQFGGVVSALPITVDGLKLALSGLTASLKCPDPAKATSCQKEFKLLIAPYGPQTVGNWPKAAGIAVPTTPLDLLMTKYWQYDAIYTRADQIMQTPEQYFLGWGLSVADVSSAKDLAGASRLTLRNAIQNCNSGGACAMPAALTDVYTLSLMLPLRNNWIPQQTSYATQRDATFAVVGKYNETAQAYRDALIKIKCQQDKTGYKCDHAFTQWSGTYFNNTFNPAYQGSFAAVNDLATTLPGAMTEYRVRDYSRIRCNISPDDPDCLTDAKINTYLKRVKVLTPTISDLNNGHHGYPWGDQQIYRCCSGDFVKLQVTVTTH